MNADVIVVLDPRRVVVEGLVRALDAGSNDSVVPVVAAAMSGHDVPDGTTIIVTSCPDGLPPELCATVRVCRFSVEVPLAEIVAEVRCGSTRSATPPRVPPSTTPGPRSRTALTEREREIIRRFADGLVSGQIADSLGITAKSVDNHKQRIFAKLGVGTLAHAIARSRSSDPVGAPGPVPGDRVRCR